MERGFKETLESQIKVTLAGATGWAGSAVAKAIPQTSDLELVSGISRKNAGQTLSEALPGVSCPAPLYATVEEALEHPCDVFFEYTKPEAAKHHVLIALERNCHVVVGTSGLTNTDYEEIDRAAKKANRGVLAVGNFALTMVLLQKFAEIAAKYISNWEILEYAHDDKVDAPGGTVRELAYRLSQVSTPTITVPLKNFHGPVESRGATLSGSQVHSIRLPGYVYSVETIFGMAGETLRIRHDSGLTADPYVPGALLAIRTVHTFTGLRRGLDSVMKI